MIDPIAEQAAISGWRSGDRAAGAALLKMHAGMIFTCARRYITDRCEKEDLIQVASIAMLHSATTYKPEVGRFLSYAVRPMKWACQDYAQSVRHDVNVPEHAEEASRAMKDPSFIPCLHAANLLRRNRTRITHATVRAIRLDSKLGDGDEIFLDRLTAPANDIDFQLDIVRMMTHVITLPARERGVLLRRCADDPETHKEIGATMGVSKQRVEQIESDAVALLRKRMTGRKAA